MHKTFHKKDEGDDEADDEIQAATATQGAGSSTKPKYPQRDDEGRYKTDEEEEDTERPTRAILGKELEKEDIVRGNFFITVCNFYLILSFFLAFNYGNTVVPLDKVDLEAMKYKNTEKCLKLLSFVKSEQVRVLFETYSFYCFFFSGETSALSERRLPFGIPRRW